MVAMKNNLSIAIAAEVSREHYQLLNFDSLPMSASPRAQIDALKADQEWQQNHQNVMSRRIDQVIEQVRSAHRFYE